MWGYFCRVLILQKSRLKGQDVVWCLGEHLPWEHPESTIYWVLMLARTSQYHSTHFTEEDRGSERKRGLSRSQPGGTELGLKPRLLTSGSVPGPSLQFPFLQHLSPMPRARDFSKHSQLITKQVRSQPWL